MAHVQEDARFGAPVAGIGSLQPDRAADRWRWWRRLGPTVALGLAVSAGLFQVVFNLEREGDEARFQELADQRLNIVRINVNAALDTLTILADHFKVTPPGSTSREDFRRLASPIVARHPFIQALEWIPRVGRAEKARYEAMARSDDLAGFRFTERDGAGAVLPVADRDEYFPVFYVEPVAPNRTALGFDLASNPVRRAALEASRDQGGLAVTGRIVLVQEKADQYGALIFAPVFPGEPQDVAERRRTLAGYVLGVLRIGDFIEGAVGDGPRSAVEQMVDIHLFDLSAPADSQQLYPRAIDRSAAALTAALHASADLEVAGRTWRVVASPSAAFRRSQTPFNALTTLAACLLATVFFAYRQKNAAERMDSAARFAREIARAKQQLSEAHRIARLGFIEFDPVAGLWSLGEGTQEMLGLDPNLGRGNSADIFAQVDPEDRARLLEVLSASGSCGLDIELRVGGRVLQALGETVCDLGGTPKVMTFQDITQRRAVERERAAMIGRVAEANRLESLGTLAGGVAHEINTPAQYIGDNLAFLKDWLPRLLDVVDAARQAAGSGDWSGVAERAMAIKFDFAARELPAAVDQAAVGIGRISAIVQAIKEFSYPSGKSPQPFDLNRAVELAATVTRSQWKHVAELSLDLAPALPMLTAIEGEINQVLVNLIVNAAQAIGEAGSAESGRIEIATRLTESQVEVSVKDSGIGIPKENLDRLFELFFTTKPPGQGTGQGLAISNAVVHRHGGTITVESEPGAGACFRVRLPIEGGREETS